MILRVLRDALSELFDKAVEKHGEGTPSFQAMGDGNHSLATAKTNWSHQETLHQRKLLST